MWLEIEYSPTSLFSLKSSSATSSAGKTLFSPSPYATKMALLNAVITYDSVKTAQNKFNLIRDLNIQFQIPEKIVVNNCMIRILKDNDKESNKEIKKNVPFKSTVALREYVYFDGNVRIAVNLDKLAKEQIDFLKKWFIHINYFGKKGCFFQFIKFMEVTALNDKYSMLLDEKFENLAPGIIIEMDDFETAFTFDSVNTFSAIRIKKRKVKFYVLPLRMEKASKSFTLFSKI